MNRYGLCCISLDLHEQGHCFKTITVKQFSSLGRVEQLRKVYDIVHNNLKVTLKTMELCCANGWIYRMSSSLYPLLNYAPAELSWENALTYAPISESIAEIKSYLSKTKLRVSLHPDQFVVPASSNHEVAERSISELENHALFMDMLGLEQSYNYPINIHMNSYRGDTLHYIAQRFISSYEKMSDSVTRRLVLENEDKPNSWTTDNLYQEIYTKIGIPITYDCLHYRCNPGNTSSNTSVDLAKITWGSFRPLFHMSGPELGATNPRKHGDYPSGVPTEFYDLNDVDFDMEFKMKDRAISLFVAQYPQKIAVD